ncbi:MAG: CBS domain-containing protein [bacterium]
MNVKDVIKDKPHVVYSVDQGSSVAAAIEQMMEHEIGALIVIKDDMPVGLLSERDVIKCWVNMGYGSTGLKGKRLFKDIKAHEVMSTNLIVVEPSDDLCYVMNVMIKNRIRHLPVVENKRLVGMLSMRDVVRTQVTNLQAENHYLKEYITDRYPG